MTVRGTRAGTSACRLHNSILHGDWALGRLFSGAGRDGWLDDTIVVVVSGHTQRRDRGDRELPSLLRIACLVLAPGLAPGVSERVCSQTDVIPTIVHLAGWRTPCAVFGRSMLDGTRDDVRGALCATGDRLIRVERDGWPCRTSEHRVEEGMSAPGADLTAIEQRLLALHQTYSVLVLRDHPSPPR